MEKHSSIIQAEAFAVIVGLILLAMVVIIIVVLVVIYLTKQKMNTRSQFTIHVARNFNDSSRDKETPVSDFDRHSLKNQANEEADFMTESLDNPLYQQTTSFTGATYEVATTGFTNPHDEQDNSSNNVSSPISEKKFIENDYQVPPHPIPLKSPVETSPVSKLPTVDTGSASKQDIIDNDFQVPPNTASAKTPVPLPRTSPRRPAPVLPIIKPKVYINTPASKPPILAKPHKQPVLPPVERPPTYTKPDVKPKPKALPRNV